jgi:hypothetical protein
LAKIIQPNLNLETSKTETFKLNVIGRDRQQPLNLVKSNRLLELVFRLDQLSQHVGQRRRGSLAAVQERLNLADPIGQVSHLPASRLDLAGHSDWHLSVLDPLEAALYLLQFVEQAIEVV